MPNQSPLSGESGPVLVYDGGCPFCSHFAALTELRGGVPGLRIRDGREDQALRRSLRQRGLALSRGAILIEAGRLHHGAEAIAWICTRLSPSAPLLHLLGLLFRNPERSRTLYPTLLAALRLAGLPVDPDAANVRAELPLRDDL